MKTTIITAILVAITSTSAFAGGGATQVSHTNPGQIEYNYDKPTFDKPNYTGDQDTVYTGKIDNDLLDWIKNHGKTKQETVSPWSTLNFNISNPGVKW